MGPSRGPAPHGRSRSGVGLLQRLQRVPDVRAPICSPCQHSCAAYGSSEAPPLVRRPYYSQLTLYQHCLHQHRHESRFMLFLDSDEILVLRDGAQGLPVLLERAFSENPLHASVAFHRCSHPPLMSPAGLEAH